MNTSNRNFGVSIASWIAVPIVNKAFALTNVAPGVFGGTAKITVANTGSIDASKFSFWASPPNAVLTGAPTVTSGNVVSLPISPLEGNIAAGNQVTVSYGSSTQTFTAGAAAPGATSIPITGGRSSTARVFSAG